MTTESGSCVEGGMQIVWVAIWLDVQESSGLGVEAV
jgi:hypothetical protein